MSAISSDDAGRIQEERIRVADVAASKFTNLFYQKMDSTRSEICAFFMENVILLWNGNRVEGKEAVKNFYAELPKSATVIHSINSQPLNEKVSFGQSLIVMNLIGAVRFVGHDSKLFSDTIFLIKDQGLWKVQSITTRFLDGHV